MGSSPLGVRGGGALGMVVQWLFSRKPVWRADTYTQTFVHFILQIFIECLLCAVVGDRAMNKWVCLPSGSFRFSPQIIYARTGTQSPRKHSEAPTNSRTHSASYSHTTLPFQRGTDPRSSPSGALRDPSELGSHCCGSAREQPSYT